MASSRTLALVRFGGVRAALVTLAPLLVPWLSLAGCSCSVEPEKGLDLETLQGAVDPNQPPEVQEKQEAIIRLLEAIAQNWSGYDDDIKELGDITFGESEEDFYGDGFELRRWDWDGPPEGDNFPLVLHLVKNEPGEPTFEDHRVYTVTKSAGRFNIRRKR